MKITEKLKAYAVKDHGCEPDADDQVYIDAVSKALADGTLSVEKYGELIAEPKGQVQGRPPLDALKGWPMTKLVSERSGHCYRGRSTKWADHARDVTSQSKCDGRHTWSTSNVERQR